MSIKKTLSDIFVAKNIEMPKLDDTVKLYTEQDLFEATEESFREGYCFGSDSGNDPSNIGNPRILNRHKKWFLKIKNLPKFKKIC